MSASTHQQLLDDDPSLADAVETVLDRSDDGTVPLQWADVSDDLTSGQWGQLIEHGILEASGDGFVPAEPDALREVIATDDDADVVADDDDGGEWTIYDKAAGVAAIGLFLGYSQPGIQATVAHVDGVVLEPLDAVLPFHVVIIVLAVITGLYSTLLQSALLDHEKMAQYQERMQSIRERREAAKERDDEEALEQIQDEQMEAMSDQMGMFAVQFRPMVWVMLVTIPVFLWMRWKLSGHVDPAELQVVMPLVGEVGLKSGSIGPMPAWIVWYFICSMAFGQLIRKSLGLRTSPETA